MRLRKYRNVFISDNLKKLTPESWIWENFLSENELKEIYNEIYSTNPTKTESKILFKYKKRFEECFIGGWFNVSGNFKTLSYYTGPKNGMAPHIDVNFQHDEVIENILVDESYSGEKIKIKFCAYGFVVYLTDNFIGGQLYYPEYDIYYQPKAGDLVIHEAEAIHAVTKIVSGERISHQGVVDLEWYVDQNKYEEWCDKTDLKNMYVDSIANDYVANKKLQNIKLKYLNKDKFWEL